MSGIKDTTTKLDLTNKTQQEKIEALAAEYADIQPEMAKIIEKLKIANEFVEKMEIPRPRQWATMLVAVADAMGLDLGTPEGMGVAALMAEFQLNLG